jgi:hypothetical protein
MAMCAVLQTGAQSFADGQIDSYEMTKGINRRIFRLSATVFNLLATKITLVRAGVDFSDLALDFIDLISTPASPPQLSSSKFRADVDQVERELSGWLDTMDMLPMDNRTRIGSLACWHTCNILLRHQLRELSMADQATQSSAATILDLCIETGDKIEFMNWVSLFLWIWALRARG